MQVVRSGQPAQHRAQSSSGGRALTPWSRCCVSDVRTARTYKKGLLNEAKPEAKFASLQVSLSNYSHRFGRSKVAVAGPMAGIARE